MRRRRLLSFQFKTNAGIADKNIGLYGKFTQIEPVTMQQKLDKKTKMTREQLRDVLKVNFELYKDEPEFFDYITTLVIYLMQYEFDLGAIAAEELEAAGHSPRRVKRNALFETKSTALSNHRADPENCPQCNHKILDRTHICPFCLALINNRPYK